MDVSLLEQNIETISAEVHNAWWKEKATQGFHAPVECDIESGLDPNNKFKKKCDKCHCDMYPYEELPDNVREYDRVTVRAVIDAAKKI